MKIRTYDSAPLRAGKNVVICLNCDNNHYNIKSFNNIRGKKKFL